MKIILTMVGIALGIAIAVVAGVYGWQQYELSRAVAVPPVAANQTPSAPSAPADGKPKPVDLPTANPASKPAVTSPAKPVKPNSSEPTAVPPQIANKMQPTAPPTNGPASPVPSAPKPVPPAVAPTPGKDTPIATVDTPNVATAEKLAQLIMGMTEEDVQAIFGKEGVVTPESQLSAYTPEGWYEVRWPNVDGSYIAALFNDQGTLAHLEPFNLPGAEEWMATPWYVVPGWLNEELRSNTMPVRLPAVNVIAAGVDTFQFSGPLVNADGQVLGSISGTYYINDPGGRFDRAMEGNYQYTLPDGSVDANTFQFTE